MLYSFRDQREEAGGSDSTQISPSSASWPGSDDHSIVGPGQE